MPYEEYIDDPEFGGIWNVKVSFMYDYMNGTIMLTVYFAPGISLIDSGKHTSYDIINLNNGNSSDNSSGGGGSSFDVGGRTEEECINCDGTGWRDCFTCNGKGYTGYGSDAHDCPSVTCNGGKVSCTSCGGDGRK